MTRIQRFTPQTVALLVTVLVLGIQFSLGEVLAAQPSFTPTKKFTVGTNKAASPTCGKWSVVSSPDTGKSDNQLFGVAAISKSNVWTVGFSLNSQQIYQTLIEHWNGTNWSIVSSPNIGTGGNFLYGVAAVSTSNIWTAGYYGPSMLSYQTLTEFYC